jgi:hypothetical protein
MEWSATVSFFAFSHNGTIKTSFCFSFILNLIKELLDGFPHEVTLFNAA